MGCGHFFAQAGCAHCAAQRATTVGEHVAAGNMLAQAQLNQQMATNAQLAELQHAAQQQNAMAQAKAEQDLRFQIASWRQTEDGKAYVAWAAAAPMAVSALDQADAQWRDAWIEAVTAQAGPDAMTPRRIPLGSTGQGVALVAGLFFLSFFFSGALQNLIGLLWFASIPTAIVMNIRQRGIDAEARSRRTAVFGFDPLGGVPTWAADRSPADVRAAILRVLQAGPAAFPPASSLPSLVLPQVNPAWPAPMDQVSSALSGRLSAASTEVQAVREHAAV
jgi:hypothetical protein